MKQELIMLGIGEGKIVSKCSECFRDCHAKGLCGMHYKRLKDYGSVDKRKKKVWNAGTRGICKVENCDRPHARQGYCNMHALRMDVHGQTELPTKTKTCKAENCNRPKHAYGYCSMHSRRFLRNGTPELQPKIEIFCSIDGCNKKHAGRGYCQTHLRRYQVWGDPMKVGSTKGLKKTPEQIEVMRQNKLGKNNEWYLQNKGTEHPRKGLVHTEKTKENIRVKKYENPIHIFSNTKPERFMKSVLSINGIKFKSQKKIYGLPDIFIEPNICVFVDGNHYHADPKKFKPDDYVSNTNKTAKQVWERDTRVNTKLIEQGFIVMRFWENEIKTNPIKCLEKIKEVMVAESN